jgi:hypothetical protein
MEMIDGIQRDEFMASFSFWVISRSFLYMIYTVYFIPNHRTEGQSGLCGRRLKIRHLNQRSSLIP